MYFLSSILSSILFLTYEKVLKLASGRNDFEQVYLDDGFQFTGASIAVFWNENILLGSPGKNLMACHKV